ncbi:polysaccharide biosynthesis protein [Nostoc sp. 3335mG]|nr:polysaccharide biosynthesis protein [Nostoc sp. 3335mG]
MVRQVSSYLLANVVSAMFGFASVVIFTRLLGPEEYGIYIVGFSIAAMISALGFGWIKSSIVPLSADGSGTDLRATIGVAFLALLLLAPPLYFILAGFAPQSAGYLVPAILLAFGIGYFEFYLEIFRARQETVSFMWATILRAAAALALSLLLVEVFDWGGLGLLASVMLSYFLTSLVYSALVWRGPAKPFDRGHLRTMLRFGLPMTLSGAVFVLQAMLDRFALAGTLGEHAAGLYGAAADLVRQILLFPGVAIGTAIAPIAVGLFARHERAELDRHLIRSGELLLAIMAPAVAGLAIVAGKLAFLVLGPEFRLEAAMLIPILALGWLFRSVSYQLLHVTFQISRKPGLMLGQGLIILALNALALVLLVPPLGLAGAALATLLSETVGVAVGFVLARRAYALPVDVLSLGKVALATLFMAVPTFLLDRVLPGTGPLDLALPVAVGVLAYGVAACLFDLVGIRRMLRLPFNRPALTTDR